MSYRIEPKRCWQRSLASGLSAPRSEAPLHLIEWCALWLIQADPIGVALSRVRDLAMAGALQTRGFVKARERPASALGEAAFVATVRAFARHNSSSDKIQTLREPFLRWLGVLPDPEKCEDLKERSNVDAEEGS